MLVLIVLVGGLAMLPMVWGAESKDVTMVRKSKDAKSNIDGKSAECSK